MVYTNLKQKQEINILNNLDGWTSITNLEKRTTFCRQTITKILHRLQAKGLIRQHTTKLRGNEGRVYKVTLYRKR